MSQDIATAAGMFTPLFYFLPTAALSSECCLLLAATGDLQAVQEYLDGNPHQLENRTVFQSNLLHIAARNGHPALVRDLLQRGIDMDALDFVSSPFIASHVPCVETHSGI